MMFVWRCRAAYRIALKLRATRPPAQGRWTKSVPRQGHNTPLPLRRSPPASFKRLLGGRAGVESALTSATWKPHAAYRPAAEAPPQRPYSAANCTAYNYVE